MIRGGDESQKSSWIVTRDWMCQVPGFWGEAVALGGAAGGCGLGHFDEAGLQRREQVVFAEGGFVAKAEAVEEFVGGQFQVAAEGFEEGFYLVGYLVGYLVAGWGGVEGLADDGEHEIDEWGGLGEAVGGTESLVVFVLAIPDEAFDGEVGEFRLPAGKCEGLPKAAEAAVAV